MFEFDGSAPARCNLLPLAKNALKKLRTTRHPDVLKFMDAVETDTTVYIMTERVRPLGSELGSWTPKDINEKQEWLLWGLHRIAVSRPVPSVDSFFLRVNRRLSHFSMIRVIRHMGIYEFRPYSCP